MAAQHLLDFIGISIPPALVGIAVLFIILLLCKSVPKVVAKAANPLLAHMSLFFIPAIVAIVNFTDLLSAFPLALFLAVVMCTLVSLAVTASVSQWLMQALNPSTNEHNHANPSIPPNDAE